MRPPASRRSCSSSSPSPPLMTTIVEGWSRRDVELRSRLVFRSIEDRVTNAISVAGSSELTSYFEHLAEDEKLIALGFCDESGKLTNATKLLPKTLKVEWSPATLRTLLEEELPSAQGARGLQPRALHPQSQERTGRAANPGKRPRRRGGAGDAPAGAPGSRRAAARPTRRRSTSTIASPYLRPLPP